MSKECNCRATTMCLLIVTLVGAVYFSVERVVYKLETPVSARSASSQSALYLPVKEEPSAWAIEKLDDPYTGIMTTTAMDMLDGDNSIVIRQTGAKLECYINTGRFLEREGNAEYRRIPVQYQFDDGKPILQVWNLANNNTSLVYPGNPQEFLQQLAAAKTFELEFHSTNRAPQTVTYEVAGFPSEFR